MICEPICSLKIEPLIFFLGRETGEKDVAFKVLYCGICHSDLHMVKNEWGSSTYPLVPGYVHINIYLLES